MIELETRSRCYHIEYIGGEKAWISGHPSLCPTPTLVQLLGCTGDSGRFEAAFIGPGKHLVFQKLDDGQPITTSQIATVTVVDAGQPG